MISNTIIKFFEGVAKFMYALLPTVLPYSTPLPIAVITASSAETFFSMTPLVAGVFVFSLEGLGVWTTTTLVDRVVEWVRSRNPMLRIPIAILVVVALVYLVILVLLNATLKGDQSSTFKIIITLVCFLPFIAGILNGFNRIYLKDQDAVIFQRAEQERLQQQQIELEDQRLQAERDFQLEAKRQDHQHQEIMRRLRGEAPVKKQKSTAKSSKTKWTDLTVEDKQKIAGMSIKQIKEAYPEVSANTPYNWKDRLKEDPAYAKFFREE